MTLGFQKEAYQSQIGLKVNWICLSSLSIQSLRLLALIVSEVFAKRGKRTE